MPDNWVTDIRHFLDERGRVSEGLHSPRLVNHFGSIVAAVTREGGDSQRPLNIKCRRKPGRKPCPGRIHAGFKRGTASIAWHCPVCTDNGLIQGWQRTQWDKGRRGELPEIDRVTYRRGMLTDLSDASGLVVTVLKGVALSADVVVAIHDNELIGTSGEYGDPFAGDPVQYDELIIDHASDTTKIVLYNRAIMLFRANDEFYKQMHRVCCTIEDLMRSA